MAMETFVRPQCHEFDAHFHLVEYGLTPYYALTDVRKEHDWTVDGKPTGSFEYDGESWRVCLDFDDQPIVPWSHQSYELDSAYLYRIYFVCADETYDGERADRSKRVKGGTITIKPRWPNMQRREQADDDDDGEWTGPIVDVDGYMDLGVPYLDAQVQASNIDFERYPGLLAEVAAAFGIPRRYFDDFYETSNMGDAAVYYRFDRDSSGPVYAPDGPIARIHSLLESDRRGYRKHVEDNRDRPGDYVSSEVDSDRAGKVIRGHRIAKEIKHYYMRDPDVYDPDEFGYHPKLEVGFQTAQTDRTIYWERDDGELDRHDLRRELKEMLVNVTSWAGLDITGGDHFFDDAYFKSGQTENRSVKLVDCPLPDIESEQEQVVMRLWGDMKPSDRAVTELLLSDGGEVAPKDAADQTGFSYRTIRRVVDRLEGFVRHTYGQLEIESEYAAQAMVKRVRAAEQQFRREIGNSVMQLADDAQGVENDALAKFRRRYEVGVDHNRDDCRFLLKPNYTAADIDDARMLAREATVAVEERFGNVAGVHMVVEIADDGNEHRLRDLRSFGWSGRDWDEDAMREKRRRQWDEQVDKFEDADDVEDLALDLEEAWAELADRGQPVSMAKLDAIVSQVTNQVEEFLRDATDQGLIEHVGNSRFVLAE